MTARKWLRRALLCFALALLVVVAILWYSLQPSLTLAFEKASQKGSYEITLDGEPYVLPYRVLAPADAGPGHSYPVLLYLSGSGLCGRDNFKQVFFDAGLLDDIARNKLDHCRCIVVAPQITEEALAVNEEILAGYMGLVRSVQAQYNADTARLYILGWSMGGDSIWALLARYPGDITAAAIVCGGLFDLEQAETAKDTPLWIFHGRLDFIYPVKYTRAMVQALEAAGGNVKYTEYPFAEHVCWQKAFAEPELLPWLFSQPGKAGHD